MNDLEELLRQRLFGMSEPTLAPRVDLASRLRRRHDRRRLAAPVGAMALVAALTPLVALHHDNRGHGAVLVPGTSSGEEATRPLVAPEPTTSLYIAGLWFRLPASMRVAPDVQGISRDVTRHDNTGTDGIPSYATDLSLTDGARDLTITVYDGASATVEADLFLGNGEHPVNVVNREGRVATTISELPPNASPDMRAGLSRPLAQLVVKVSTDRTLLLIATGFSEEELIAFASEALAGR